jgi:hypothetical protein
LRRSSWMGREAFCGCSDRRAGLKKARTAARNRMRWRMVVKGPTPSWTSQSSCWAVWCHCLEPGAVSEGIPAGRARCFDWRWRRVFCLTQPLPEMSVLGRSYLTGVSRFIGVLEYLSLLKLSRCRVGSAALNGTGRLIPLSKCPPL